MTASIALNGKIQPQTLSGLLLLFGTIAALLCSNTSLYPLYSAFLQTPVSIDIGAFGIHKPLVLWINDGLMAVFFFMIGLEIKREVVEGELSSFKKASLPVIAALGGILLPALIYITLNNGENGALHGWGVPVATDIAFALAILALLGRSVPRALKILLLSLAIIDDIAAILIIAIFYTEHLSFLALGLAAFFLSITVIFNLMGMRQKAPYILIGVIAWACVLKSGIHATLAGVLLAFVIPMTREANEEKRVHEGSPLKEMEHGLYPWVSYLIVPLFAFANAGIRFEELSMDHLFDPLPLGIMLGLFFGKQLGVFSFIYGFTKMGLCSLPANVSWLQVYGMALLTGIGFTMSLFIGALAFDDPYIMAQVRVSVFVASLAAAASGYAVLKWVAKQT